MPCGHDAPSHHFRRLKVSLLLPKGSGAGSRSVISPPDLILLFGDRELFPSAKRMSGRYASLVGWWLGLPHSSSTTLPMPWEKSRGHGKVWVTRQSRRALGRWRLCCFERSMELACGL